MDVKVLVVEDEGEVRNAIVRRLTNDGHVVDAEGDPRPVLERLDSAGREWDVVLLDIGLPEIGGIEVLRQIREAGLSASVIMLTGDDSANTATECMRAGAFHYLTKPFRAHELSAIVSSAARHAQMRRELGRTQEVLIKDAVGTMLVGTSSAMRKLRDAVTRLGGQDVSVLIRGESGTGKELVARALHEGGPRRTGRFVALNCGAIPESLIDSELFGHVKGAFTGATSDRTGVFAEANGGTLFLDEIGDMPMGVQARLLRVLQEGTVRAIGGNGERKVDVRVVAATHVDLASAVEAGRFRQDLFYRLNVVVLNVPPMRERLDDLPLLVAHFLRKHAGERPPMIEVETLEQMSAYAWPGNVRELENALLHALALRQGDALGPGSLPFNVVPLAKGSQKIPIEQQEIQPFSDAKRQVVTHFEQAYLTRVLKKAKGSVSEAARLAGLDRANFRRLLQRYGMDPAAFRG